VAAVEIDQNLV